MGLITEKITYNVRERGRKFRGQNRNFDTVKLAELINGPETQERVKHRDMVGYYGHWPRLALGMRTPEGGIVAGAVVHIAPALITVELSADQDGNVTHRAEFLDTEPGQIAESLFKSKQGGFSSAIDTIPRTSPAVPTLWAGLDFVLEPNFSTNRGHKIVMDSADDTLQIFDHVLAQAALGDAEMACLFDSLSRQHTQALEAMERLAHENDDLIGRLARGNTRVLDSAGVLEDARIAPIRGNPGDDFERFRHVSLARLQVEDSASEAPTPESNYVLNRFGVKL